MLLAICVHFDSQQRSFISCVGSLNCAICGARNGAVIGVLNKGSMVSKDLDLGM
jgi:hypothetical protein